jgi:peptidase M1-like protein
VVATVKGEASVDRYLLFLPVVYLFGHGALHGQTPGDQSYQQVFDQLRTTTPRSDRVATVHHFVLRRDVVEFRLDEGRIALLSSVAGRTPGAVFVGSGSVAFAPPLGVERAYLRHELGDSVIDTPISSAVFIFADSTLAELEHRLTFSVDSGIRGASSPVGDALGRLVDAGTRQTDPTLMSALLNGDANGFFYAHVKRPRGEDLMFEVDPSQMEEIALLRRGRLGQKIQTVSQFQRVEDLADTLAEPAEPVGATAVTAYDLDATIEKGLDFSGVTTVRLTAKRDAVRWELFYLYPDLEVDSILQAPGVRDTFFRTRNSAALWVRFAAPLRAGQADSIRIAYHGKLIVLGSLMEQFIPELTDPRLRSVNLATDSWFFIKSTALWFPRQRAFHSSDVRLTFHTPRQYQLASIGRLVDSQVVADVRTTHWVAERPTNQVSFSIGRFKDFEIHDPRIPPVLVHVNAEAHARLNRLVPQPRDPEELVGADVANSLAFFTQTFGPPLFARYYATEIPYGHGQAFPGLIHLSWFTFQSVDESGFNQLFRAHEMAHQWWGIGVEPAGERDTWLSEGFADFAGLLYMQRILKDNKKFFHQLDEWRKAIRARREDAPPIALGHRALEGSAPQDFQTIVYDKGAWVLQMLRNMMLDLRTMNEDAFNAMMQDFYRQYRGGRATTQDFQRVVERHVGGQMGWFFNQWVYGTALPTYVLSWKAEPGPDNRYILRVRVRQENVPEDFMMPVPLNIEFSDGTHALVRLPVRGPLTDKELRVPAEPKRLELNALYSVLADVRTEHWHE